MAFANFSDTVSWMDCCKKLQNIFIVIKLWIFNALHLNVIYGD